MVRGQFEGAVQFLHHPAESQDRRDTLFPVDPHLFAEIAEECEVGRGRRLLRLDGLFAESLASCKMFNPGRTVLSLAPEIAFMHRVGSESLNRSNGGGLLGDDRYGGPKDGRCSHSFHQVTESVRYHEKRG